MASVPGLFRRGASYYLKVVLPLDHPARERYRSGRQVVSLGACSFREAVRAGTVRRAEILHSISPLTPPAALPLAAPISTSELPTLREVFRRWSGSKRSRSADSVAACRRALAHFEDFAGQLTLDGVTRDLGDAFRAWLQDEARGTTPKTARDRLTWVKSLLRYAHRDLGLMPSSPWAGLDFEARTTARRRPWTAEELGILFAEPLHTRHELPAAWNAGGEAAYWLPLLGLYTGARLSELAQLAADDVQQEDGVHFLDINDDRPGKRLKTEAGRRRVPLHSELIRLGFLDHVAANRAAPSLWPDLRQREGKPGGFYSVWFGTYRRAIGLGARPDFHCLRHTVRTALSQAEVAEPVIDALLGHEVKGSTGAKVYTHRTLAQLKAAIERMSHPGVALRRVYRAVEALA